MPGNDGSAANGLFSNFAPEEIVLIASIFAIAIASELSDEDANALAFFLSTLASNIGLYVDRRSRGRFPEIPGLG